MNITTALEARTQDGMGESGRRWKGAGDDKSSPSRSRGGSPNRKGRGVSFGASFVSSTSKWAPGANPHQHEYLTKAERNKQAEQGWNRPPVSKHGQQQALSRIRCSRYEQWWFNLSRNQRSVLGKLSRRFKFGPRGGGPLGGGKEGESPGSPAAGGGGGKGCVLVASELLLQSVLLRLELLPLSTEDLRESRRSVERRIADLHGRANEEEEPGQA